MGDNRSRWLLLLLTSCTGETLSLGLTVLRLRLRVLLAAHRGPVLALVVLDVVLLFLLWDRAEVAHVLGREGTNARFELNLRFFWGGGLIFRRRRHCKLTHLGRLGRVQHQLALVARRQHAVHLVGRGHRGNATVVGKVVFHVVLVVETCRLFAAAAADLLTAAVAIGRLRAGSRRGRVAKAAAVADARWFWHDRS